MEATLAAHIVWIMLIVVALGGAATVAARLALTCPVRCLVRVTFFLCLPVVGLATASAMLVGSPLWTLGGATLAIMAVGSTWEVGRLRNAPAF
ncbi:MAG: hypothetical protein U0939_21765 [Pirellulales bacterium]